MQLKKHEGRKIVILTLFLMLLFSMTVFARPYLSKTDIVIKCGDATEIKIVRNTEPVVWHLINSRIAELKQVDDNTVVLTGTKTGTAKVSATVGTDTYTCTVTICNFKMSKTSLKRGQSIPVTLKGASLKTVTWSTTNDAVIKVKKTGNFQTTVKAVGTGKAMVVASVRGKKFRQRFTVTDPKRKIAIAYDSGGNTNGAVVVARYCGYASEIVTHLDSTSGYDALILPGGPDINPSRYGQSANGARGVNKTLDSIQFKLIDQFVKANKPVIGFCRGQQVINVYFGGTLKQYINGHLRTVHGTKVLSTSYLAKIIGTAKSVNSYHHQCIDRLGDGLTAIQWASDGTIEAVVHQTLPIYGFQWHPEIGPYGRDTVNGRILRYIMDKNIAFRD